MIPADAIVIINGTTYGPDNALRRGYAARCLGMGLSAFDRISSTIPNSPLYAGSTRRVWFVRDLLEYRHRLTEKPCEVTAAEEDEDGDIWDILNQF